MSLHNTHCNTITIVEALIATMSDNMDEDDDDWDKQETMIRPPRPLLTNWQIKLMI